MVVEYTEATECLTQLGSYIKLNLIQTIKEDRLVANYVLDVVDIWILAIRPNTRVLLQDKADQNQLQNEVKVDKRFTQNNYLPKFFI